MNSESPNQTFKVCNACKRKLPTYYFGLRKFSADGYNPCCKECRNFRRRKAYQTPIDTADPILPLNTHNTHFLWSIPDATINDRFVGLDLTSLIPVEVTFKYKRRTGFWITIKVPSGAYYTHAHFGEKSDFIPYATLLLERLKIRLFYPTDQIALTNWGLTTT